MLSFIILCALFYLAEGKAFRQRVGEQLSDDFQSDGYNLNDGMQFLSSYYQKHSRDTSSKSALKTKNLEQYTPFFNGRSIIIPPDYSQPYLVESKQEDVKAETKHDQYYDIPMVDVTKDEAKPSKANNYDTPIIVGNNNEGKPDKPDYEKPKVIETPTKNEEKYEYDIPVVEALTKTEDSGKPEKYGNKKTSVPVGVHNYEKAGKVDYSSPVVVDSMNKNKVKPYKPDNQYYNPTPVEIVEKDKLKASNLPMSENYKPMVAEINPKEDKSNKPESNYESTVEILDKNKQYEIPVVKTENKDAKDNYGSPAVVEVLSKNKVKPSKPNGEEYEAPMVVEVLKKQKADKDDMTKNKAADAYYESPMVTKTGSMKDKIPVETGSDYESPNHADTSSSSSTKANINDYNESPSALETLSKKEKPKKSDENEYYESPIEVSRKKEDKPKKSVENEYYESPIVVEVLSKKKEKPEETAEYYENPKVVETLTKKEPENIGNEDYSKTQTIVKVDAGNKKSENKEYHDQALVTKTVTKFEENDKSPRGDDMPDLEETKIPLSPISDSDDTDLNIWTEDVEATISECLAQNNDPELKHLCRESDLLLEKDKSKATEGYKDILSSVQFLSRSFISSLDSSIWSILPNSKPPNRRKFKQCLTRRNETGNCMPVQFCSTLNAAGNLEELFGNVCVIEDMFLGVCCPAFPVETIAVDWDEDFEILSKDEKDQTNASQECGEISSAAKRKGAWPWMAPLISVSTGKMFCGGALINDKYILTAAHCTTKIPRNQILIRLGQRDSNDHMSAVDYKVVEIKRHAGYNPRTLENDIALLKLSRRVPLGQFKGIVCLPAEDNDDDYVDKPAVLIGWNGFFNEKARKTEFLTVMSQKGCADKLGFNVADSILCTEARKEDERTCNVDSGAPLIINPDDGDYKVIGVLSWNRNDCDQKFPSTFTRVSHYRGWIKRHAS